MKNIKARPTIGQKLQGNLSVEGVEIPISLEAKQLMLDSVGCLILNPDNDLIGFIKTYFEVELEVFTLKPEPTKIENSIETNHLKGSPLVQLWWRNNIPQVGPILEYRISFFGSYVEGGTSLKHRYGSWTSGKQDNLDQRPENIWARVKWENFFPVSEKEKLLKIITYAPELTPEEKNFLKSEIKKF